MEEGYWALFSFVATILVAVALIGTIEGVRWVRRRRRRLRREAEATDLWLRTAGHLAICERCAGLTLADLEGETTFEIIHGEHPADLFRSVIIDGPNRTVRVVWVDGTATVARGERRTPLTLAEIKLHAFMDLSLADLSVFGVVEDGDGGLRVYLRQAEDRQDAIDLVTQRWPSVTWTFIIGNITGYIADLESIS